MLDQLEGDALAGARDALASGDAKALGEALERAVRDGGPRDAIADVAGACLASDEPGIRNAGAMALMDAKAPGAGALLRAAIRRPGVAAQSGTLVYVLQELGERLSPADAAHIAAEGSHEARMEMVEMLREDMLDLSDRDALPAVLERLDELADDCDEMGAAASEVLAALDRMGAGRRTRRTRH